ncbi:hypothetical protein [Streptomyces fuscichromogenes]|uniref:Alcohol dehydrogenase n=1 Tax=Streptomyces fuscichromogenes TaxID=1324013 RepID=A0A917X991_9ACTN|nr:hypothetical protein GCM10011578_016970 [Streptomyces fuscichromogenes]
MNDSLTDTGELAEYGYRQQPSRTRPAWAVFAIGPATGSPVAGVHADADLGFALAAPARARAAAVTFPGQPPAAVASGTDLLGVGPAEHFLNAGTGTGGVGPGVVTGLRLVGADPIVAVDLSPERLAVARRFGATHTLDGARDDVEA